MSASDILLRLAIALPLGLVFGSFLTVAIHRVPAGESMVRPRSLAFRDPIGAPGGVKREQQAGERGARIGVITVCLGAL